MAFISVSAGQPIRATHVTQFSQWLSAVKVDSVAAVAATSATEYVMTVRSQETSTGLALSIQYGLTASSATTIASFSKDLTYLSNWYDQGGVVHDVRAYGTLVAASLSTTAAVAALTGTAVSSITVVSSGFGYGFAPLVTFSGGGGTGAAATAVLSGSSVASISITNGGTGYTTAPTVTVYSAWSGTDNSAVIQAAINGVATGGTNTLLLPNGVYLTGSLDCTDRTGGIRFVTNGVTRLVPSLACGGQPVIDASGSAGLEIRDLQIGDTANPTVASCGILIANSSTHAAASNVHVWDRLKITGYYVRGCVYVCAGVSSRVYASQFQQNYDVTGATAIYFSASNSGSMTSAFTTLSATGGVGEWGFFGCEFHDVTKLSGTSVGIAMILEGTYGMSFFGGNIGGNGSSLVRVVGATQNLTFHGVQMYAQDPGGVTPTTTVYLASGSVTGLSLVGCRIDGATSILGGASGVTITRGFSRGNTINGSPTNWAAFSTSGALVDCDFDCYGLNVDCGAAGTITRGFLRNPNAVTAGGGNTAEAQQSDGSMTVRAGYVTLGSTVAGAGNIRGENAFSINARNQTNNADLVLISSTSSDVVTVGAATQVKAVVVNGFTAASIVVGSTTRVSATTTGVVITGTFEATGGATFGAASFGTGTFSTSVTVGSSAATSGALRLANGATISFRNLTTTGDIVGLTVTTGDNVLVGSTLSSGFIAQAANTHAFNVATATRFHINATGVGFNGSTAVAAPNYTVSNPSVQRTLDVSTADLTTVRQVLGTVLSDLGAAGTGVGLFS